jgi:hypothetical protein
MLEFVVFRKSNQPTKTIHAGHKNNKHFFQQMFFNIMIPVSIKLKMFSVCSFDCPSSICECNSSEVFGPIVLIFGRMICQDV